MKLTHLLFTFFVVSPTLVLASSAAKENASETAMRKSSLRFASSTIKTRDLSSTHFKCGPTDTDFEWCINDKQECVDNACHCVRGREGPDCVDIDICKVAYPCSGVEGTSSFCVDEDPPKFYMCGCMAGYDAVLPDQSDVVDPVPASWRPTECVKKIDDTPASESPSASPSDDAPPVGCQSTEDCTYDNEVCDDTQSPPSCICRDKFFRVGGNCQAKISALYPPATIVIRDLREPHLRRRDAFLSLHLMAHLTMLVNVLSKTVGWMLSIQHSLLERIVLTAKNANWENSHVVMKTPQRLNA